MGFIAYDDGHAHEGLQQVGEDRKSGRREIQLNEIHLRGEPNEASKYARNSNRLVNENALRRVGKLQPVPAEEIPVGKGGDDLNGMSTSGQGLR